MFAIHHTFEILIIFQVQKYKKNSFWQKEILFGNSYYVFGSVKSMSQTSLRLRKNSVPSFCIRLVSLAKTTITMSCPPTFREHVDRRWWNSMSGGMTSAGSTSTWMLWPCLARMRVISSGNSYLYLLLVATISRSSSMVKPWLATKSLTSRQPCSSKLYDLSCWRKNESFLPHWMRWREWASIFCCFSFYGCEKKHHVCVALVGLDLQE